MLLDGLLVNSCLVLAVEVQDRSVTTIEGVASLQGLHPVQEEFLTHGAVQCGFCTPGMIMAAKGILDNNPTPPETEIRSGLKGNLCRCTGYKKVVEAVMSVTAPSGKEV